MERSGNERFTLSPNFGMSGWDYEWGGRVTIGSVPDCVHGYEIGFTGVLDWDMAGSISGAGINTLLSPAAPFVAANISEFSNATFQSQTYNAEYWSIEANRTLVGWDVAKLLAGMRYISYDEDYNYFSQGTAGTGLLRSNVENQLIGIQGGMDLLYPISKHGFTDFRARVGGFVNLGESQFQVLNAGNLQVSNASDDEEIAGVFEMSTGVRYQLGPALSIRGGVEIWYLTGIGSAVDQFSSAIFPAAGSRTILDDDVLMTGISFGADLRY